MSKSSSLIDDAWDSALGGLDWLKSVLLGEFADNRSLSAMVADMLVSFVPGVVIVTSARDAVAVIVRLAQHPEKRDDSMEWIVLSACLITLALPLAMAAGGAAAAGVGAIVGGIAGSELGAALRAVMLLLIKEAAKLGDVLRFLQKFMKGDLIAFLRAIKFAQYEKALLAAFQKTLKKLIEICQGLRGHLEHLKYFDEAKRAIATLTEWERKFYAVQTAALKQIPLAMAELDLRLKKLVAQIAPKEEHLVAAAAKAPKPPPPAIKPQHVNDAAGQPLLHTNGSATGGARKPAVAPTSAPPAKPAAVPPPAKPPAKPPRKNKPDPVKQADQGRNNKRQDVADATPAVPPKSATPPDKPPATPEEELKAARILADRQKISALSSEAAAAEKAALEARAAGDIKGAEAFAAIQKAKIDEARAVLEPHVVAGDLEGVLARLDVSSPKGGGFFWSGEGALEKSAEMARGVDGISLETTLGGRIANDWDAINKHPDKNFSRDFWGGLSKNYAEGVEGPIRIVQSDERYAIGGGYVWKNVEIKAIAEQAKVTGATIYDLAGNVRETLSFDDLVKLNEKFKLEALGK